MFNEDSVLEQFYSRATAALAELPDYELIFVDDGSSDSTFDVIQALAEKDPHVKALRLSRNFGQQTAMTAGVDVASGDTVTVIDADLQDPPELIPRMVDAWRGGADVVFAVREHRVGETWVKKATAHAFYRLMRRTANVEIPLDHSEFRLMSRRAADGLRGMRERSRFMRGLVSWMGFERAAVTYTRDARYAGQTKYSYRKLSKLAVDGLVSFSTSPLQLATWLGFGASLLGFMYGIYLVWHRFTAERIPEGWTSIMVAVLFFGGVQLMAIGIIGEYVGRIFEEVRGRPLYLVSKSVGLQASSPPGPAVEE